MATLLSNKTKILGTDDTDEKIQVAVNSDGKVKALNYGTDGVDDLQLKTDDEGKLILSSGDERSGVNVFGTPDGGTTDVQVKISEAGEIITDPIKDVDLAFNRDANGLISSVVSVYNGRTNTQTFGRDANNQLTSITSVIT